MMLLAGCGLSTAPQPTPAVPTAMRGLLPAPRWVADRMAQAVPDVCFDINSHILRASERGKLDQIAGALEALLYDFPDLVIVIEGHADDRGLVEYNERLALERAEAVQRVLWNHSFPEDCLRIARTSLAAQCRTDAAACHKKNRCVHIRAAQAVRDTRPSNPFRGSQP